MSVLKEMDSRFVNLERKLGFFIIVAVTGVVLLVVLIGIQKELFVKKTILYVMVESGRDITKGMPIKLSGFKIGNVKSFDLDEVAMVRVELAIDSNFMQWVKADSEARLIKEGVIGDTIFDVIPGSPNEVQLDNEDILSFERERGLSEMAEEVSGDLKKLILEVGQIVHYINDPKGDIKSMLGNINKLSEEILVTRRTIDDLVKNVDSGLAGNLANVDKLLNETTDTVSGVEAMVRKMDPILNSAGSSAKTVDESLPGILKKVEVSLSNVEAMTGELKKAVEETAPTIPVAAAKGEELLDDTGEIMDSVKNTWPISSNIENKKEEMLSADSYE